MLFDDERPPESRLVGEYEEITWNDDLLKDNNNTAADHHQYEVVNLPVADLQPVQDEHQVRNCFTPTSSICQLFLYALTSLHFLLTLKSYHPIQ